MKALFEELQLKYNHSFVFHKDKLVYISSIQSNSVTYSEMYDYDLLKSVAQLDEFEFQSWIPQEGYYPNSNLNCSMLINRRPEKTSTKSFALHAWNLYIPSFDGLAIKTIPYKPSIQKTLIWGNSLPKHRNNNGHWEIKHTCSNHLLTSLSYPIGLNVLVHRMSNNEYGLFYKDTLFAKCMEKSIEQTSSLITNLSLVDQTIFQFVKKKYPEIQTYLHPQCVYD